MDSQRPLVSAIIPAYNARATLALCLEALFASETDIPYEVIVVDDGSKDDSAQIAAGFSGVRVISKENGGSASAKNHGAAHAEGDYFWFVDSDVVVFPDALQLLVETQRAQPDVDMVYGCYHTTPMNDAVVHHYKAMLDYAFYVPREYWDRVYYNGQSNNGTDFYTRRSFEAIGGFNAAIPGASVEREDCYLRFREAGFNSVVNPAIRTRHFQSDFWPLAKNYIHRIHNTFVLLEGRESPFTYMRRLPILGTALSALAFPACLAAAAALPEWRPILAAGALLFFLAFILFSRDFFSESWRRKGMAMTLKFIPQHMFFTNVIVFSGGLSLTRLTLRRLMGRPPLTVGRDG